MRFNSIGIKILILFLFGNINARFCSAQDIPNSDCKIYLNISGYSFEITDGFPQVYKLCSQYGIFSQECNSLLNFIFLKKKLNNFLFPENIDKCEVYYEKNFNRCCCDTATKLFIYYPPKEEENIQEQKFNKDLFDASLYEISDSAIKALSKAYPQYKIKIEISSEERMLDVQEKYFRKGASKTLLSTHMIGAAADFKIFFNEKLIDPKIGYGGLFKSIIPYQILGKYVLDKGYFWGIEWDPGHIQLKRKLEDILIEFPDLQSNGNLIASYCKIVELDSIPIKYKPVIDILDEKFGVKENRKYDTTQPWVNDTLLVPVNVNFHFKTLF